MGMIRARGASAALGGRRGRDGDRGAGRGRRLQVLMKRQRRKAPRDSLARSPEHLQPPPGGPEPQPRLALPVLCRRCPVTTASPVTGCSQVVLLASSLQGREGTGAERREGRPTGSLGPLAPAAPQPPLATSPARPLT